MPSLHILKGANQGATVPLEADRLVIGRNPECDVVIPLTSVSREHAQIVRAQGRYLIEDLQSRNGTFVNNQAIAARTPLNNNDRIRICDFLAVYLDGKQPDTREDDGGVESSTTVEATLSHNSNLLLETQPAEKLRGLLEISSDLSRTLDLDPLLPKIVDSLFQLFKQADRAFLILSEEGTNKLMPKVIKTRRPQDESTARFSRSIVRQCLETAQAFLSDDASQDNRVQLSQSVVDFRIRSVMCVPLANAEGKAFGVIQLDTQERAKKFTKSDLELLCGVANQASIALENARLHAETVAQERLKRDLELAHEVQLGFLPQKLPEVPGYEFHAFYRPAYMVGGDYYDFVPLSGRRVAMALGDVAGKGVPAALLMAKLSSDARFCFLTEPDLAKVVGKLNDQLALQCAQMDRFVTLAAAVLDPTTHVVTLVNAGHPSPLLYRQATGTFSECTTRKQSGLALGIMEGYAYEAVQVLLQPGDALLIFSDGVPDANNVREEQFNTKGIQSTLAAVASGSPRGLIDRLLRAIEVHTAGAKQNDDITMVALGRTR
jgi:serine phosphatase RsbU (regulator of sigma subunit)/pSer/pThr/pTyr-binding forkhead associated (FHA) protein